MRPPAKLWHLHPATSVPALMADHGVGGEQEIPGGGRVHRTGEPPSSVEQEGLTDRAAEHASLACAGTGPAERTIAASVRPLLRFAGPSGADAPDRPDEMRMPMASSSKKRTTMAKIARENAVRERRFRKQARK